MTINRVSMSAEAWRHPLPEPIMLDEKSSRVVPPVQLTDGNIVTVDLLASNFFSIWKIASTSMWGAESAVKVAKLSAHQKVGIDKLISLSKNRLAVVVDLAMKGSEQIKGIIQIWDCTDLSCLGCITQDKKASFETAIKDGAQIAIGYKDGTVEIWDAEAKDIISTFCYEGSKVEDISELTDESMSVCYCDSETGEFITKIWDYSSAGTPKVIWEKEGGFVGKVDEHTHLFVSTDGSKYIWNVQVADMKPLKEEWAQDVIAVAKIGDKLACTVERGGKDGYRSIEMRLADDPNTLIQDLSEEMLIEDADNAFHSIVPLANRECVCIYASEPQYSACLYDVVSKASVPLIKNIASGIRHVAALQDGRLLMVEMVGHGVFVVGPKPVADPSDKGDALTTVSSARVEELEAGIAELEGAGGSSY